MAFRLMIVDDSAVMREMLRECLAAESWLEVVATASNGRQAIERLERIPVDAVLLDVEMPEMGGLETLIQIRKEHPHVRVVMFSALTRHGASITLEALEKGADDYFPKPSGTNLQHSLTQVREGLIPKLRGLLKAATAPETTRSQPPTVAAKLKPASTSPTPLISSNSPIQLLTIGASTGGPNALAELLSRLPQHLSVPIVIVQHMPPLFTQLLAERLSIRTGWKVTEATQGEILERGRAVIAPGDHHLEILRKEGHLVCQLSQSPPIHSVRPAVDVTFPSAAQATQGQLLGLVLTGMGYDGRDGAEQIVRAGGMVLVQDQESSVVWGMPGAVVRAGWASGAHDIPALAELTIRRIQAGRDGGRRL